jgi:hypothetical protein
MNTECDLDIVIVPHPEGDCIKFYIKIYKNGGLNIKKQMTIKSPFVSESPIDIFVTNDGIPFPPYVIFMLTDLFSPRYIPGSKLELPCPFNMSGLYKIIGSIKRLQEELVKAHKLRSPMVEHWFGKGHMAQIKKIDELAQCVDVLTVSSVSRKKRIDELEQIVFDKNRETITKDKKISELEKLVEDLRGEIVTGEKTISQLLSDLYAKRLLTCELVRCHGNEIDKLDGIVTHKNMESITKDKKIVELEKRIAELTQDPSDAELDIRAKEGAKRHAEAKAKLQKMYDERPVISLVVGESIGDLMVDKCITDLLVCM